MKLTGDKSLCRACGCVFSTTSNFDKHRVGRHGVDRKCAEPSTVGLIYNEKRECWMGPPRDFGTPPPGDAGVLTIGMMRGKSQ